MCREKSSIIDLAYGVVPAWSRYVVSARGATVSQDLEHTEEKGFIPFINGYSFSRIVSTSAEYPRLYSAEGFSALLISTMFDLWGWLRCKLMGAKTCR